MERGAEVKTIDPIVLAELEAAIIDTNSLRLTRPIDDRKLYVAVDKIIKDAGGKWSKGAQKHLFPSDPRERLGLVLTTGKSISIRQETQAFYTPPEIAERVIVFASVEDTSVFS